MLFVRRLGLAVFTVLITITCVLGPVRANPMLLVDMDSYEVLYAQDAGQPWHPASLTKLMTAFVTFQQIAAGKLTLESPVILSQNAINQAPSKSGLPKDSALSLNDALYVMIVKSANDVATAIAETVGGNQSNFVAMMNASAAEIGLTATHFVNPNGLHNAAQVTSARDLAVLSLYIHRNFPQYDPMFGTEAVMLDKKRLESNNSLLTGFQGTTGMKTGFVCASGLNIVATVHRQNRNLIAVVLGGSSARDRNERTAQLLLRGLSGGANATGQTVFTLPNLATAAPVDMRSRICGADSKAYVAAQQAEFPLGLKGQPSYLSDNVAGLTYQATNLGRVRPNIPLPRIRPAHATAFTQAPVSSNTADLALGATSNAPVPRLRPSL